MRRYLPNQFNKRIQFGNLRTIQNANTGGTRQEFISELSVWFASKTRSLKQSYELTGTIYENTKTIIVRHNLNLEHKLAARIDGIDYEVVNYSPDETNSFNAYDFVTLKKRG